MKKYTFGLTPQREKFARCMAEGMSASDAYRKSYRTENMSTRTLYEGAARLSADPIVAARVSALQAKLAERSVLKAEAVLRETARLMAVHPGRVIRREVIDGKERATVLLPPIWPNRPAASCGWG